MQTFRRPEPVSGLSDVHRCPWWMQYVLASPLRRLVESPQALVGPHVSPGMTVLDAGCGFGYFALPMARMVGPHGRVLAADVEPRAIARLAERARRSGVDDRIVARACGPRDLGFTEYAGRVNLVTAVYTLHEFEDLPGFLSQVAALLAPSGRMLVVEPAGHVTPEQFAAELRCCRAAGFHELDPPAAGRRQRAALLAPPAR